jgi:hypothetical protein
MSKAYRALLRERPELAAISDAEIRAATAAIDMVDRMTADLSHFELLEAYARTALAAAAQVRVELNVGMIIHRPDAMVLGPLFALCPIDKH